MRLVLEVSACGRRRLVMMETWNHNNGGGGNRDNDGGGNHNNDGDGNHDYDGGGDHNQNHFGSSVTSMRCSTMQSKTASRFAAKRHGRDVLTLGFLLAAAMCFVKEKCADRFPSRVVSISRSSHLGRPRLAVDDGLFFRSSDRYARGIAWSVAAVFGNVATSSLRKSVADLNMGVGHTMQVGIAALVQGLAALAFCWWNGSSISVELSFWCFAVMSGTLNAVTKTFETRAFAIGEMSLCAPFLAFDPVMQFVVAVAVMPVTCVLFGWGCGEGRAFTARHGLAIASIARGMFTLATRSSSAARASDTAASGAVHLPPGAGLILVNCVLYSFTSRFDQDAIRLGGRNWYYACNRLLMAASCFSAVVLFPEPATQQQPNQWFASVCLELKRSLAPFKLAPVACRVLCVAGAEAIYMLSLYRAVVLVSPVFATAVKRGGGVLASSLFGAVAFGEKLEGRGESLMTITIAVTLLCL